MMAVRWSMEKLELGQHVQFVALDLKNGMKGRERLLTRGHNSSKGFSPQQFRERKLGGES